MIVCMERDLKTYQISEYKGFFEKLPSELNCVAGE